MHIEVPRIGHAMLRDASPDREETSATIRARVTAARQRALDRSGVPNAALTPQQIKRVCRLDAPGQNLLEQAIQRLGLSHRAYHRILKVARTIADVAGSADILPPHVGEAISYRRLDRQTPAA